MTLKAHQSTVAILCLAGRARHPPKTRVVDKSGASASASVRAIAVSATRIKRRRPEHPEHPEQMLGAYSTYCLHQ